MNYGLPIVTSESEWAWLAGIIEGVGCISIDGRRLWLVINMTDEDVLINVAKRTGRGKVVHVVHHRTWQPHWKEQYRWEITGSTAQEILRGIYPWLGDRRRRKADEALAIQYRRPGDPRKTHCKRGHPLRGEGADVYVHPDRPMQLNCVACRRERTSAQKRNFTELTDEQIRDILSRPDETQRALAAEYGCYQSTIWRLRQVHERKGFIVRRGA